MKLNELFAMPGSRKSHKRVGRGIGSGTGKTSGKGVKGQGARSGVSIKGFEGGQMPIIRRLPKRGFNPLNRLEFNVINLGDLDYFVKAGKINADKISKEILVQAGIIKKPALPLKLLASGEFNHPATIEVDFASKKAIEIVSKNGGKVVLTTA